MLDKNKIKRYTPRLIWKLLSDLKRKSLVLEVYLITFFAKSNFKLINNVVKNRCKKLTWLDCITPVQNFKATKTYEAYEPNYHKKTKFNIVAPEINLYKFHNAKAHSESSHIILDNTIVMERLPNIPVEYCNYSTGFIKGHKGKYAVYASKYKEIEVDKAFFLGGNGSWNYYHWTIEIITKLKYFLSIANIDKDLKIILPVHAKNIESFSVMIEILLDNKFDVIYLSEYEVIKARELYIITSPSNVVYNTKHGIDFKSNFLFFDKESISYVRNSVLDSQQYNDFLNSLNEKKIFRKIYIARRKHAVRSYNHDEVLETVTKYGFQPVYLEELSFFQQVHLFQNAQYVIGASGAAWTNLVFIKSGVKGLSWLGENIKFFSCYSTLAEYYGCDLQFFTYKVGNRNRIHSDYFLDLRTLEEKILRITE